MLSEPFPADTWRRCLAAFQALAPGSRVKISVAAAQSVLETFSVSLGDKPKELEEVCGLDRDAQTGSDPIHVIRIESAACDQDLEIILSASRGTSSLTAWQHLTDALQTHDRTLRDVLGAQLARIKSAVQLNSYAGVLDYMPKPAFLINHRKRVVCSNEVGERVVREGQCVR